MIRPTSSPSILILASRFDFTCDYVVSALIQRGAEYLRVNSEDLSNCAIDLDPLEPRLTIQMDDSLFEIKQGSLRAVLFRRPVFLRDYGDDRRTAQDRFARIQWASFLQNLAVFDEARWYNAPSSTYLAEHKAMQLREAVRAGMDVPPTSVTNEPLAASARLPGQHYAIKGLDTVMVREEGDELFGFTTFANTPELQGPGWSVAPAVIQWAVPDKLDIRVTVVAQRVFAAAVLVAGGGVPDDWRLHKDQAEFVAHDLPSTVEAKCIELVRALGLRFGAIDLAFSGGTYYFLEINPTGEWAWLVDGAGLPIDEAIADELSK